MNTKLLRLIVAPFVVVVFLTLGSCASMMSSVTAGLADDLAATILNSDDVDTVREGVPAYLLMIDSFLRSSPDNPSLLMAASSLNGAFSIFTSEARSELLTTKSLNYAAHAACLQNKSMCELQSLDFQAFSLIHINTVPPFRRHTPITFKY